MGICQLLAKACKGLLVVSDDHRLPIWELSPQATLEDFNKIGRIFRMASFILDAGEIS